MRTAITKSHCTANQLRIYLSFYSYPCMYAYTKLALGIPRLNWVYLVDRKVFWPLLEIASIWVNKFVARVTCDFKSFLKRFDLYGQFWQCDCAHFFPRSLIKKIVLLQNMLKMTHGSVSDCRRFYLTFKNALYLELWFMICCIRSLNRTDTRTGSQLQVICFSSPKYTGINSNDNKNTLLLCTG